LTTRFRLSKYAALAALAFPASLMMADSIGYTGAVVTWTAPTSGTYTITAIGAQGGEGTAGYGFVGGLGAEIEGTFFLSAGTVLDIAVGGEGQSSVFNGGGGGGTFVVDTSNDPLIVAGGGGGIRVYAEQNGTNASITEYAYDGSCASSTFTPALKTSGLGQGGNAPCASWGAAGGGFNSNGAADGTLGNGGDSWFAGLAGGTWISNCGGYNADGGFGGGGSGDGCAGGGGGGGYSGGDGGFIAGGGGSYDAGADPFAEAGVGEGNGSVDIALDSSVPEPSSIFLLVTMLTIIGLLRFSVKRRGGVLR